MAKGTPKTEPGRQLVGEGRLRRVVDARAPAGEFAGTISIHGIAYELTGYATDDPHGRFFTLRVWLPPLPAHLHVPLVDDPPPGAAC